MKDGGRHYLHRRAVPSLNVAPPGTAVPSRNISPPQGNFPCRNNAQDFAPCHNGAHPHGRVFFRHLAPPPGNVIFRNKVTLQGTVFLRNDVLQPSRNKTPPLLIRKKVPLQNAIPFQNEVLVQDTDSFCDAVPQHDTDLYHDELSLQGSVPYHKEFPQQDIVLCRDEDPLQDPDPFQNEVSRQDTVPFCNGSQFQNTFHIRNTIPLRPITPDYDEAPPQGEILSSLLMDSSESINNEITSIEIEILPQNEIILHPQRDRSLQSREVIENNEQMRRKNDRRTIELMQAKIKEQDLIIRKLTLRNCRLKKRLFSLKSMES